jgi:hypothetical protein
MTLTEYHIMFWTTPLPPQLAEIPHMDAGFRQFSDGNAPSPLITWRDKDCIHFFLRTTQERHSGGADQERHHLRPAGRQAREPSERESSEVGPIVGRNTRQSGFPSSRSVRLPRRPVPASTQTHDYQRVI